MTPYILHVALILAGCVAFYKILLVNETFFRLNRFVLLACLALSFSMPLIPVPQRFSLREAEKTAVSSVVNKPASVVKVPVIKPQEPVLPAGKESPAQSSGFGLSQLMTGLIWLYWSGVAAFGINFLVQIITLLYRSYSRPVIRDGRFRIVELSGDEAPCSFGNSIFINPEKYDWDTYNQILLHEKIHIREGHSFDLLFAEIVLIFQWFNPFAWIYRKELESNLEYLTDQQLLEHSDIDQESYQLSLLKVSAPHFPLSLTTNYNQSLLKKRVTMMNAKKSNVNTTWKYLFLVPFLLGFVCLLNKPVSSSAALVEIKKNNVTPVDIEKEGAWFATIKGDSVSIQFKTDGDKNSNNSNEFALSEFKDLPRDKSGTFTLTRDAGTIQFTGKFEGQQGMGRYKFSPDKSFASYLEKEGIRGTEDEDMMAYFLVGVSRSYIGMLKSNGYTKLDKDELIPLAALDVDAAFIKSLKDNGYNLEAEELIPLKALGVDGNYIREIKKAGYPNITPDQLITFKAQGITGKYIADYKEFSADASSGEHGPSVPSKPGKASRPAKPADSENSAEDMVAFKALGVDADYVKSMKNAGYDNLSNSDLVAMKSLGVDAEYIAGVKAMKLENVTADEIIAFKAQDITPEFVKQIRALGYDQLDADDVIPLKALGITPEYIKSFREAGFKDIQLEEVVALKAQNITPATIQEYKALGFENVEIDDVIGAKATGTTPAFIRKMREKGHKFSTIQRYITLKTVID
ncbi:M56 family metallopeptidase [Flavihumibacter sp. R14]|nr:M56 family metallopeptidase [Flavihumibacter soli]